ncbi:MAG: hypothetical protein ACRDRT_15475, partial [Pseudonocardiaceae bacterium]
ILMSQNKALLDLIEGLDKVIERAWKILLSNQNTDSSRLLEVILKASEMKFQALMASEVVSTD